jgi:hypothetical protein
MENLNNATGEDRLVEANTGTVCNYPLKIGGVATGFYCQTSAPDGQFCEKHKRVHDNFSSRH